MAVFLEGRVPLFKALVIGNNAYTVEAPLSQCVNDAEDMAQLLNDKGYSVQLVRDACLQALRSAADAYVESLVDGCTAVVFYGGHGMAAGGCNFLVPIDGNQVGACAWEGDASFIVAAVPMEGCQWAPLLIAASPVWPCADLALCLPLDALLGKVFRRLTDGTVIVLLDACRSYPMVKSEVSAVSHSAGYVTASPHPTLCFARVFRACS